MKFKVQLTREITLKGLKGDLIFLSLGTTIEADNKEHAYKILEERLNVKTKKKDKKK